MVMYLPNTYNYVHWRGGALKSGTIFKATNCSSVCIDHASRLQCVINYNDVLAFQTRHKISHKKKCMSRKVW